MIYVSMSLSKRFVLRVVRACVRGAAWMEENIFRLDFMIKSFNFYSFEIHPLFENA